ncbi:MAG TPA: hypothetical protein VGG46_12780 [Terriglobales bacterium]|jgi:hypothetical protein
MSQSEIFSEKYRVIGLEAQSLILQGVRSGEVLKIKNADISHPLTEEEYPVGKLIALSNPSTDLKN